MRLGLIENWYTNPYLGQERIYKYQLFIQTIIDTIKRSH